MEQVSGRFRQRFEVFDKAFLNLDELKARDFSSFSTLEKEGIIQWFEILVNLSWKVLKDFLENEGFLISSPKDAIRQAFSSKLFGVDIADKWLESLNIRNLTSHTYTQDALDKNVRFILDEFLPLVKNLQQILKGKLCDMG